MIVRVDLVVEFNDAVVVVFCFENGIEKLRPSQRGALRERYSTTLGGKAEHGLGAVNQVSVGRHGSIEQLNRLKIGCGICGRFGAALTFVVREDERLVFVDRTTEPSAKLILAKNVGVRCGLQK